MGLKALERSFGKLDQFFEATLTAARVPGAAVAIVSGGETVLARGYGHRALETRLPMDEQTVYPIASTTKSINATLIGMLVDEGKLAWDVPVQSFMPRFRLGDIATSAQVTIRDLLVMRTGLPRHDWLWFGNAMSRSELVSQLRHLDMFAGFREKYQYNNLTPTTAAHIAEIVTERSWEDLVKEKIFVPLGMSSTSASVPAVPNMTLSYHESDERHLLLTQYMKAQVTAPSGGAVHSTVGDMARWMKFNLSGGKVRGTLLIQPQTLTEIHSPQVVARTDTSCPTPNATYAMGWFVDVYNGHPRVFHGGYLHDVNSSVMLFPEDDLGIVSFINFGPPRLARIINEHVFDLLAGHENTHAIAEKLTQYEESLTNNRKRISALSRVPNTAPGHPLTDYVGAFENAGYGRVEVCCADGTLGFQRGDLSLRLEHWHYDVWAFAQNNLFEIHEAHSFDRSSRICFESNADGAIAALLIQLEPAVAPIRFTKR